MTLGKEPDVETDQVDDDTEEGASMVSEEYWAAFIQAWSTVIQIINSC